MYQAYPILSLCHNHWKLDQMVTDNYSSWKSNHFKAKAEDPGSDLDDEQPTSTKRQATDAAGPAVSKKKKFANNVTAVYVEPSPSHADETLTRDDLLIYVVVS